MEHDGDPGPAPEAVRRAYPAAEAGLLAYARFVATAGVDRGLVGPREVPRLWERHLLNCAVLEELIPRGVEVIDIGSGAGLPGLPVALVRPDLTVHLVEPLQRRTTFLEEAVSLLGLQDRVQVHRGRAEAMAGVLEAPVVTSRAVAPLDVLVAWSLPLVPVGGRMLALKGTSAAEELLAHREAVHRAGGDAGEVLTCGADLLDPPTTVLAVTRIGDPQGPSRRGRSAPAATRRAGLGSRSTWNTTRRGSA